MRTNKFTVTDNERLYATRRMAGENQQEVAKRYGFHQTGISKMESGEIPVNPRLLKDLVDPAEIPDYVFLSILRRRYHLKISLASREAKLPPHRIGDIERGRTAAPEEYVSWLHNVAK